VIAKTPRAAPDCVATRWRYAAALRLAGIARDEGPLLDHRVGDCTSGRRDPVPRPTLAVKKATSGI
jgi:hypothetical protein